MKLLLVLSAVLLSSCQSSSLPPIPSPDWEAVPIRVTDALCGRLKMDSVATGDITVVRTTQPLVVAESLAALHASIPPKKRGKRIAAGPINRAIPIHLGDSCSWRPTEITDVRRKSDEMVVEISAPIVNPDIPSEAGLFVRVSLGGEHPAWYWIPVAPRGGGWVIGQVMPLVK